LVFFDVNGLLSVHAKDKGTGKEQSITIKNASTLDKTDIERMVKEAEALSKEDKEKRSKIDLKNQADLLCYQSEKQVKDLESKISQEVKEKVEKEIQDLRQALESDNFEKMKACTSILEKSIMDLGQSAYTSQEPRSTSSTSEDEVIDTDFTD